MVNFILLNLRVWHLKLYNRIVNTFSIQGVDQSCLATKKRLTYDSDM